MIQAWARGNAVRKQLAEALNLGNQNQRTRVKSVFGKNSTNLKDWGSNERTISIHVQYLKDADSPSSNQEYDWEEESEESEESEEEPVAVSKKEQRNKKELESVLNVKK